LSHTEGECRIWHGKTVPSRGGARYGQIKIAGRLRPAHRVAFELEHGVIPPGLEPDHLGRRTLCIRVEHLEAVTHGENLRRAIRRPRVVLSHCRNGHLVALLGRTVNGNCRTCQRVNDRRRYAARKPPPKEI